MQKMPAVSTTTVVTAIASLITGYFFGQYFSQKQNQAFESLEPKDEKSEESDDESDSSYEGNFKMVLVVRSDLGMTKGKVAAQCGHATLACYKKAKITNQSLLRAWERSGQAKIALKCDSEDKLLELEAIALSLGLTARTIQDAGRTQIASGSRTVLGIGPGPAELIDQATGKLKLL